MYALALCSGAITGATDTITADSKAQMETWIVQTPAAVEIVSVSVDTSTIDNNNNDTILLTVVARNTGEATLIYTGDTAVFSNVTDSWTKVSSTRGATLAGGSYDTFYQIYKTASDTGTVTVNQIVHGVDANDSRTVSDSGAATTASVTVDIPRPFRFTRVEASRQTVSDSQTRNWTVTVTVKNMTLDTALMDTFTFDDLAFRLTSGEAGTAADYLGTATATFMSGTTTLAPGAEDTIIYTVTQTGDSAGELRVDVTLTGFDIFNLNLRLSRGTSGDDTTVYDTVLVQNRAALSVVQVAAAADSVTRAQDGPDSVTVTVEVRNTGDATANLTMDTLTFLWNGTATGDSFTALWKTGTNPTSIAGNTSDTFTYVVSVSNTANTGPVVIEATCSGTDANSQGGTEDTRATRPDTWIVQAPAQLLVDTVSSPNTIVFQGQSGYTAVVYVKNAGEARLSLPSDSIQLSFFRPEDNRYVTDSFTISPSGSNPSGVGGGRTDTYLFTVSINAKVETGTVYVDAICTGADGNRPSLTLSDTTAGADTAVWDLQGAGVLDIVQVRSETFVVSRSETSLVVTMQFRNIGDGVVTNIATPTLRFSQGSTDLTSQFTGTLTSADTTFTIDTLPIGAVVNCTYSVTISSSATTGDVDLNATVSGTVSGGANTSTDTTATTPDSWNVQRAADLTIASLTIASDTFLKEDGVGTGVLTDTFLITVTIQNNGQANVDATVDTSDLVFKSSSGADITTAFYVELLSFPDTIAGLDTKSAVFRATVPDTKADTAVGVITATLKSGRPRGADLNSGADASASNSTSITDTFELFAAFNVSQNFTVSSTSGGEQKVAAAIPGGKFPEGTTFSVVINPTTPAITTANATVTSDFKLKSYTSLEASIVQIKASKSSLTATKDIEVKLKFDATDVSSALERSNLRAFKLNETTNVWELVDDEKNQVVDLANSTVTAMTSGFSFFRVLVNVPVSPDLSTIVVYPNPFKPNDGNTRTGVEFTGAAGTGVTFANLTQNVKIRIYTLTGELVDELSATGQGRVQWDAKNSRGQKVSSGIYIYHIDGDGNEKRIGKLAVVR